MTGSRAGGVVLRLGFVWIAQLPQAAGHAGEEGHRGAVRRAAAGTVGRRLGRGGPAGDCAGAGEGAAGVVEIAVPAPPGRRCRRLAAHLAEVDVILARTPPPAAS